MYQEQLFELIRKEEVVVWAGAGMSLYAGYPTGANLRDKLYSNLTKAEQSCISANMNLPDMAEEIFRIKGGNKNFLISFLSREYRKTSKSNVWHKKIASIPHFKAIVTTNYDKLFEDSYKEKGHVIIDPKNISYSNNHQVPIYKVHGDLSFPDSIILTNSDYNNFFKNNIGYNSIWTSVKSLFYNKHVLFLGYSLEDPNVSVIYDKLLDELGDHIKNPFFVAPKLLDHKIKHLARKGINYIDSKGEIIIDKVIKNIKENINKDFENGWVSSETYLNFFKVYGGKPVIMERRLISLMGLPGKFKSNITFDSNSKSLKSFSDLISGQTIGELEIPGADIIKGDYCYAGIKIFDFDKDSIIKLTSTPIKETKFDIKFEDGFEINEIPVKIYRAKSFLIFQAIFKSADLKIEISISSLYDVTKGISYNLTIIHKPEFSRVKDGVEFYTLVYNLGSSKKFTVYYDGGNFSNTSNDTIFLQEEAQSYLNYFNKLITIEKFYRIHFVNIAYSLLNEEYKNVKTAYDIAIKDRIESTNSEGRLIVGNSFNKDYFKNNQSQNVSIVYSPETLIIHGQEVNLGYKKIDLEGVTVVGDLDNIILEEGTEINITFEKMCIIYSKVPFE